MGTNAIDCSVIEKHIDGHNLYISTTQDQINKLDPQDPDIQNQRAALTRKLNNLQEQLEKIQGALEDCRQGKGANLSVLEALTESDTA